MIKKLTLINFRGIKEGSLELGDLTILVGSNNSAKTTILESLFLAPNPLRFVPYMTPHRVNLTAASLIHELHKTLNSVGYVFLLYKYTAEEAAIRCDDKELKFIKHGDFIRLIDNKRIFAHYVSFDTPKGRIESFGQLGLSSESSWTGDERNRERLLIPESLLISSELVKFAQWYIYSNWAYIANCGIPARVAEDISHLVNEEYTNITIEPFLAGNLTIFGLLKDGSRIRLGDLGAGTQVYIISRILYELKNPQILLWDDVEAHMNPRMLIRIAEWFSELIENGTQVVVTTHSLEVVRILAEFNRDAKIYVTSLENGILKARKLTIDDVENLLSAGIDIRMVGAMVI